jgi:hypothetical protein
MSTSAAIRRYRFLLTPASWLAPLVIGWAAWQGVVQWRGHSIVEEAGLPPLPSRAWITHVHTEGFLLEKVTMGFTAPAAQMDEWKKAVADWNPETAKGRGQVLEHTLTYSPGAPSVVFTATLSGK